MRENKISKASISQEMRDRIIDLSLNGKPSAEISRTLSLKYKTVWRIIDKFNKTGESFIKTRGGNKRSKLTELQKNEIIAWVDQDCLLRISDLKSRVYEKFGINISLSTIQRVLNDFHYTLKTTVMVPERRNDPSTIETRKIYASEFRNLEYLYSDKNFIFIDEVGFSVVSRPKRGRSKIRTSTYVSVRAAKSRNISVVAAMNKYGMIYHKIHDRALNGENFKFCVVDLKAAAI
ncbi:hypothetical protein DMUE_0679 [Dictyocoela muelleri]|nr:hypothetical protein DMUE_0679 [Dictyocoela muelleri]